MSYDFDLQYVSTPNFALSDILSRHTKSEKFMEDAVDECEKLGTEIKSVMEDTLQVLTITFNMIEKSHHKRSDELQLIIKYLQSSKWPYIIDSK